MWKLPYRYEGDEKELDFNFEKTIKKLEVTNINDEFVEYIEVGKEYQKRSETLYMSPVDAIYAAGFFLTKREVNKLIKEFTSEYECETV